MTFQGSNLAFLAVSPSTNKVEDREYNGVSVFKFGDKPLIFSIPRTYNMQFRFEDREHPEEISHDCKLTLNSYEDIRLE